MKPSLIQELDPNSNKIDPETGLRWYDIQMFGVKGQGWADTQRPYARLSVWQLAQRSAGLCLLITGMPISIKCRFRNRCAWIRESTSKSSCMRISAEVGEVVADFLAFMLAYSAHG